LIRTSSSSISADTLTYAVFPGLSLTLATTTPIAAVLATPISVPTACGESGGNAGTPKSTGRTSSSGTGIFNVLPVSPTDGGNPTSHGDPLISVSTFRIAAELLASMSPSYPSISTPTIAFGSTVSSNRPSANRQAYQSSGSGSLLKTPPVKVSRSNLVPPYPMSSTRSSSSGISNAPWAGLPVSLNPADTTIQRSYTIGEVTAGFNPSQANSQTSVGSQIRPSGAVIVTSALAASRSLSGPPMVKETFSKHTSVSGDLGWQVPVVGAGTPALSPPTIPAQSMSHTAPSGFITIPTAEPDNSNLPDLSAPPLTIQIPTTATVGFPKISGTTTPSFNEIESGVSSDGHTEPTDGSKPHPVFFRHAHFCEVSTPRLPSRSIV